MAAQAPRDHDPASVALLSAACGIADAAGFVHTGVFAANMTGNTVLAGLSVAHQDWPLALDRIVTLATFFAGAMLGRAFHRVWSDRPWLPLLIEAAIIAAAAFVDPARTVAIWLVAGAIGLQATAAMRVRGSTISTVVVTSTMARLAENAVDALARRAPAEDAGPIASSGLALAWGSYAAGAIAAVLLMRVTAHPLLASAAVVLLVSVIWKLRRAD
jgi:uncharacterized membrane protein YoaK (UPF0700 family)